MTYRGLTVDPAAIGALLGVIAAMWRSYRADRIKQREIAAIKHEIHPNGGSSLRDAIDRIEADVRKLTDIVEANRVRNEYLEHPRKMTRRGWLR